MVKGHLKGLNTTEVVVRNVERSGDVIVKNEVML